MKAILRLCLIASITVFCGVVFSHLLLANFEVHLFRSFHSHSSLLGERSYYLSLSGIWLFSLSLWKLDPKLRDRGILWGLFALLVSILMPVVC